MQRQTGTALFVLTALLLSAGLVAAAGSSGYTVSRWTLDGGGGGASGGGYSLVSSIGQADAATVGGGDYTLGGGFLGRGLTTEHRVYLPLVIRGF